MVLISPESVNTQRLDPQRRFDDRRIVGSPIMEVVISEADDLLLILSNGMSLEVLWGPSGNQIWAGELKNWTANDKNDRFLRYWERDPITPSELVKVL